MKKLTEIVNTLNSYVKKIEEAKEEYRKAGKSLFQEAADVFFAEFPEVKAVVWNQYTPYFNDGDPCYFRIGDIYMVGEGYDEDDMGDAYSYEESPIKNQSKKLEKAFNEFSKLINQNDDLMESLFDDHVTVHLRPGKEPEALEYDHE